MINESEKSRMFSRIEKELIQQGFSIDSFDDARPWGGFFVIAETQAEQFSRRYFDEKAFSEIKITGKLSPKILIVAPQKRLSWQYHHRRAEIWKVVEGPVAVMKSATDEEGEIKTYQPGDLITLQRGERHRLIGLESWGVIAEIWQHTDTDNPSNEDDIIRVQDDFGR